MISVLRLFRQRLCSARYGGSWLVALFLLWGLGSAVLAQSVQAIPALTARVIDTSARLSVSDLQTLEERYAALERRTGSQVVALIVKTTQPEDIFSYAHRVASAWKIGRKEVGDGVLIVIASEDRRLRIEVARALEGAIPDLAAKQIIDQSLSPSLRQGNYVQALTLTADALEARISGEGLPAPTATNSASDSGDFSGLEWLMLLLVATPVVAKVARGILGRGLGSIGTGGLMGAVAYVMSQQWLLALGAGGVALLIALLAGSALGSRTLGRTRGHSSWPGGWGGGGGFGGGGFGGGGGGFGSGGGGSFGGGGASGSF